MPKTVKTTKAAAKNAAHADKRAPLHAITMRQLQRISAADIEALPGAVPIKSGDRTVGILRPVPHGDPQAWARATLVVETAAAARSRDVDAKLAAHLGELADDE